MFITETTCNYHSDCEGISLTVPHLYHCVTKQNEHFTINCVPLQNLSLFIFYPLLQYSLIHHIMLQKVQWNLSYPNPLGPGMVHKSEKSISLKLCINNLKIFDIEFFFFNISIFSYPNRTVTILIEQSFP